MPPTEISQDALRKIQELIKANFTGRDELYAAAESLDDAARRQVCRRLAEHLAGHAVDLQQIVTACGCEPAGPLDMESIARALFDLAKANHGQQGVLNAAAEGEHNLKQDYDRVIGSTSNVETENLLRQQREDVEFGEQVLRGMGASQAGQPDDEG